MNESCTSKLVKNDVIKLAVVINSFNRCQLLEQSLNSIYQAIQKLLLDVAIVIFDAGSSDGSIQYIDNFTKSFRDVNLYLLAPSSEGESSFSHGCNSAINFAIEKFTNLEFILFFETDNFIKDSSSLLKALQFLRNHENIAAVGFSVERFDGRKAGFGAAFPSTISFILGQQISKKINLNKIKYRSWNTFEGVPWLTCETVFTSPLLVKYLAWVDVGLMDAKRFPFSDSDTDWCWRAARNGWEIAVLDVPGVIHDNQQQQSAWSFNRVLDFHRSRFRLLLKHRGTWIEQLRTLLFLRHCLELVILAVKYCCTKKEAKSLKCRVQLIKSVFRNYEY